MKPLGQPDERSILLNALADEMLSDEQEQRLAELLHNDSDFRREYVCFCQMLTQLHWQLSAAPSGARLPENSDASVGVKWPRRVILTACISAALAFVFFISRPETPPAVDHPRVLAVSVASVSGRIRIEHGDRTGKWVDPEEMLNGPVKLRLGDRVQTGRDSVARLTLPDGTEFWLRPGSEFVLPSGTDVEFGLPSGSLSARVSPQEPGRPLIIRTPDVEVRVLGTELEVLSAPERSEVAVLEGKVRVTRNSDGSSRDVSAGHFLSVPESGPFSVKARPLPPGEWSVDFEEGVPAGWVGHIVRDGLPKASQGAITSAPAQTNNDQSQQIRSPVEQNGLFAWHDDSVLHLTFRIQPPEWFHIFLSVGAIEDAKPTLTYCYAGPELWQSHSGEWRTVSIPLSEFRLQTYGQSSKSLGRIPTQVSFRGESDLEGLEIDRIWVARGLPSRVNPRKNDLMRGGEK